MPNQYATTGGMRRGSVVTLKASGAETASTVGGAVDTGGGSTATVTVTVSAHAGTSPTLVVAIQGSADGTNWVTLGTVGSDGFSVGNGTAPANINTNASFRAVYPATQFLRYSSTIGGSAGQSLTYSVSAAVS